MQKQFVLEVCAFSLQSAIIAEQVGAARVELCDNPHDGGTTASYGTIQAAREKLSIKLYPIIRPRGGNFLYDAEEFDLMKRDIKMCKELGCDGIATGIHLADSAIDRVRMKQLVELAYPMKVTCHRVFDLTPDPFKALEDLIDCGCERILTSGQKDTAGEGADLIQDLVKEADSRIIIMPGSGIRALNLEKMMRKTGANEFHTSARKKIRDRVQYAAPDSIYLGHNYIADENELRSMVFIGNKKLG